ncbi:hypothetical protein ScPMuIL_016907 [Solemya velum]
MNSLDEEHTMPRTVDPVRRFMLYCRGQYFDLAGRGGYDFFTGGYGNGHSYVWASGGSLTYTNWMPGEPKGVWDCVVISWNYAKDSVWDDVHCSNHARYICEKSSHE